jgi:protein-disulfide isomerase
VEAIRQPRLAKAKTVYVQSLRAAANVVIHVAPPQALPVLRQTPVRGPKDAAAVILEYSDYECPYCQANQADLEKIETAYKDKIAFA